MDSTLVIKSQLDTKELMLLESEVRSKSKNMVVAYLLWWFLGIFGGHRFYMGKTGSAVTMLILTITVIGMVVTWIWWIVDAFLTHSMVKEHNDLVERDILRVIQAKRG